MPELDGFALLREMKTNAALRHIPVILLSARSGEDARIQGLESGADDYLTKPFSARELVARVRSQIALTHADDNACQTQSRTFSNDQPEHVARLRPKSDADSQVARLPRHQKRQHSIDADTSQNQSQCGHETRR